MNINERKEPIPGTYAAENLLHTKPWEPTHVRQLVVDDDGDVYELYRDGADWRCMVLDMMGRPLVAPGLSCPRTDDLSGIKQVDEMYVLRRHVAILHAMVEELTS